MSPSPPPTHTTALPAGYVLEGYRIERMLGEGGFGITYLGVDVESGKKVAIKELLPKEFATRTHGSQVVPHGTHTAEAFAWSLDSFMNEARTLAGLSHGNVVPIHRLFRANGTAYMVMDYVDGQSMRDWLKGLPGPPTEAQLRGILMPLLDGLEHVHEAGLLHRDIKPDNIFITTKGKPVLLDFGSARLAPEGTQTMTSLVSAGYSPMEQYQQRARQSAATDLYALAASMVRAITGQTPATAIDRVADASLQAPVAVSHQGRYSPAFLRAVDAAFEVHAAQRPQSVAAWRGMLEGGAVPVPAKETRTGPRGSVARGQATRTMRGGPASPLSEPSSSGGAGGQNRYGFRRSASKNWLPAAVASLLSVVAGVVAYLMLGQSGGKEQRSGAEAASAAEPAAAPVPVKEKKMPPVPDNGLPPVPPAVPVTPPPAPAIPVVEHKAGDTMEVTLPGGVKMTFCWCPPGEFMIGSPASEEGHASYEDQVRVRITKGYWLARTEVTQGQWASVMGTSVAQQKAQKESFGDATGVGAEHPMYFVSWEEAGAFIEKMNGRGGLPAGWKWGLPSEAQWEYACRAGTTTAFSFGSVLNGKEANCDGNFPYGTEVKGPYLEGTREVGSYGANEWGLKDMHGNVWEWCGDWFGVKLGGGVDPAGPSTGFTRVLRGGSWIDRAVRCRTALRFWNVPGFRTSIVGFRPALVSSYLAAAAPMLNVEPAVPPFSPPAPAISSPPKIGVVQEYSKEGGFVIFSFATGAASTTANPIAPGRRLAIRRGGTIVARIEVLETASEGIIANVPSDLNGKVAPDIQRGDEVIPDVPH